MYLADGTSWNAQGSPEITIHLQVDVSRLQPIFLTVRSIAVETFLSKPQMFWDHNRVPVSLLDVEAFQGISGKFEKSEGGPKTWRVILWGPWMSAQHFMPIHPSGSRWRYFQSGVSDRQSHIVNLRAWLKALYQEMSLLFSFVLLCVRACVCVSVSSLSFTFRAFSRRFCPKRLRVIHTFIHWWRWLPCKVPTSTSAVWGSVSCPQYTSADFVQNTLKLLLRISFN